LEQLNTIRDWEAGGSGGVSFYYSFMAKNTTFVWMLNRKFPPTASLGGKVLASPPPAQRQDANCNRTSLYAVAKGDESPGGDSFDNADNRDCF